jgi:hypothetical protein
MNKKSLDRKAAKQFIIDNRAMNKTDQEIYNELSQQYYDKKAIALLITSTVTIENKRKYQVYNSILIGFIGITVLFKILAIVGLVLAANKVWYLLFAFLVPIFNVYFLYEVARYTGSVYRMLAIWVGLAFLQSIGKLEGTDLMINLGLCILIAGLALYLDKNMFPNYSPNNLKKDSKGEYIVS